jgi:hypothetical protein
MATKFEQSKKDVEKKSYGKEGSKKDMAADKKEMAKPKSMPKPKGMIVIVAKPMKKK